MGVGFEGVVLKLFCYSGQKCGGIKKQLEFQVLNQLPRHEVQIVRGVVIIIYEQFLWREGTSQIDESSPTKMSATLWHRLC